MNKMKVGIIGCGKISGIYMENCHRFDILELYAVADLDQGRAEEQAVAFNVPNVYSVDEILADPEIELIINLTIPGVHADVCLRALEAGKHVYVEKPLAVTREQGQAVLILLIKRDCLSAAHRRPSSVPVYRHH